MPLHLSNLRPSEAPPGAGSLRIGKLSRRTFIALCLAGCSQPHREAERPKPAQEQCWALISDPHISEDGDTIVRGSCMAANLRRVIDDVVRVRPDHILFNGDLAFATGESGDYAAFCELIAPLHELGKPIHLTLGNHDHRGRLANSLGLVPDSPVTDKYVSSNSVGGIQWLFLDSLEEVNAVRGRLGAVQREWLARQLACGEGPAIVCVHHNPDRSFVGLTDAEELLAILRPHRRVKLVLFGHTHEYRTWQDEGLHFVNLPASGYRFIDPTTSLGWIHARIGNAGALFEFRGITNDEPDHGVLSNLLWRTDV